MLTLHPGSACDVCAEEYGVHRPPHCIPCGHILCAPCCLTIVEKTSSRLVPVCPFCREEFTYDSVRVVRLDFSHSGRSTPRRLPVYEATHELPTEVLARRADRLMQIDDPPKPRSDARRLQDKVARVAATKTSVEEVSKLHRELEDWLMTAERDEQSRALSLSSALLRAILMNHSAHSEASKNAKFIENNLKAKIDELEEARDKLEAELRRQRNLYAQKSQECQNMHTEVNRLKTLASILPGSPAFESRPSSTSPTPTPPSTSPVPMQSPSQNVTTTTAVPMTRSASAHSRSTSMTSRSVTPAPPIRPYTPAPTQAYTRSQTPAVRFPQVPSSRTYTPAPLSPARMVTPSSTQLRAQTPAPTKSRSVSQYYSPPKMMRSASDEKAEVIHERWIPPPDPDLLDHGTPTSPTKMYTKYVSRPPSRMTTFSTLVQQQHSGR